MEVSRSAGWRGAHESSGTPVFWSAGADGPSAGACGGALRYAVVTEATAAAPPPSDFLNGFYLRPMNGGVPLRPYQHSVRRLHGPPVPRVHTGGAQAEPAPAPVAARSRRGLGKGRGSVSSLCPFHSRPHARGAWGLAKGKRTVAGMAMRAIRGWECRVAASSTCHGPV